MAREFGKLTLTIDPAALKEIVAESRLTEFTNTISKLAAEQIPAQVIDHLVKAGADAPGKGAAVGFALVMEEGGGYGTKPHLPFGPHGPVHKAE